MNDGVPPVISVIFPTIQREHVLLDSIDGLFKQSFREFEIIVVDQTPDSNLYDLLCGSVDHPILYIHTNEPSASRARNIGALHASGEILLFLDDDIIIESDNFLQAHMNNYDDASVCGVAGQVLALDRKADSSYPLERLHNANGWLHLPLSHSTRIDDEELFLPLGGSGNMSIRKDVFVRRGGFNEHYIKGAHREETDYTMRMVKHKERMIFDPKASLVHIGDSVGGVRSWDMSRLRAMHHIVGEYYFILSHIPLVQSWPHFAFALKRQVFTRYVIYRPWLIPVAIYNAVRGFIEAIHLKRIGPKYMADNYDCEKRLTFRTT